MDSVYSLSHADKPTRAKNWLRVGIFGLVVLCLGAVVGSALTVKGWSPFKGASNNPPLVLPETQPRLNQPLTLNTGFSAVAKAVTPAVVVIRTRGRVNPQQSPFFNPFEEFFNDPDENDGLPQPRRRVPTPPPTTPKGKENKGRLVPTGTGSGVIVTPDGYIITNNHVVEGAERVEVELADKRVLQAKVIGADPPSDVAVIKLDATGLPTVPLGDSNQAEVGDIVLAVGNPLGIGQTVTMGIISAKGRSTSVGGNRNYEDFLQTDAPINRGNSGGALVNLKGELVGIPSQILSPSGGSIGIGFAIPTNMARKVMEQLVATGTVKRGLLGVSIQPVSVNPEVAEGLGYKGNQGVIVQSVEPGLSADKAGVKAGDIILEFEGKKVDDSNQLRNMVSNIAPGTAVKFKIWREGKEQEMTANLVEANALKTVASNAPGGDEKGDAGLGEGVLSGVKVENITSDLSQRLNMTPNLRGVIVANVDEDSPAATTLRRGDVIQSVNRQPVNNVAEFSAAVKKAGNKRVLLYVQQQRGGVWQGGYVTVSPQE
jgi:Do/DeqQ family serine protease